MVDPPVRLTIDAWTRRLTPTRHIRASVRRMRFCTEPYDACDVRCRVFAAVALRQSSKGGHAVLERGGGRSIPLRVLAMTAGAVRIEHLLSRSCRRRFGRNPSYTQLKGDQVTLNSTTFGVTAFVPDLTGRFATVRYRRPSFCRALQWACPLRRARTGRISRRSRSPRPARDRCRP